MAHTYTDEAGNRYEVTYTPLDGSWRCGYEDQDGAWHDVPVNKMPLEAFTDEQLENLKYSDSASLSPQQREAVDEELHERGVALPVGQHPEAEAPAQASAPEDPGELDDPVPYRDDTPFSPMVQDPITGEWREAYESEGGYIPDPEGDVLPPDVPEGIPGVGVPYRDFIPQIPMVQDPATAEWRNAEPGEIDKGQSGDPNTPPEYGSQEVSPLQFGNTANLQTAGERGDEGPPPPASPGGEGEEEYSPQEVPPLQFGNTANLESAQAPLQFGNTANLEFGPGTETEFTPAVQQSAAASAAGDLPDPEPIQTLDPALFDPSAPGPTLDPSLFDPAAPGPTLDPALLDPTAPGETIDPALLDSMTHGSTLDPYLLEQSVVEPGGVADPYLTAYPADPGLAEPYTADQDVQDQGFEDY